MNKRAYIVLVAVLLVILLANRMSEKRSRHKKQLATYEAIPRVQNTIFLILVWPHATECQALKTAFTNACDPARIVVAYASRQNMHSTMNIKSKTIHEFEGVAAARAGLVRSFYKDERYVCIADANLTFQPGWDGTVVRMHDEVNPRGRNARCVITGKPMRLAKGTFLRLESVGPRGIVARPHYLNKEKAVRSLAYSNTFAFAYAELLKDLEPIVPSSSHVTSDTLCSAELYDKGWTFISLYRGVATREHKLDNGVMDRRWHVADPHGTSSAYQKFADVLLRGQSSVAEPGRAGVGARGALGIVNIQDLVEINIKFGDFDTIQGEINASYSWPRVQSVRVTHTDT